MKQSGEKYLFTYPYYGTPDSYPEYTAHSGQNVTVLRKLNSRSDQVSDECVMYEVRAQDGWVGHAHEDELSDVMVIPNEIQTQDDIDFLMCFALDTIEPKGKKGPVREYILAEVATSIYRLFGPNPSLDYRARSTEELEKEIKEALPKGIDLNYKAGEE